MENEKVIEKTTEQTNTTNRPERKALPKEAFDSEYMTEFLREVRFLTDKGIKYTFVRKTGDYGVSQYKYKKTPALFAALVEFYSTIEAERNVRRQMRSEQTRPEEKVTLTKEQIEKAQQVLKLAAEKIKEEDDTI